MKLLAYILLVLTGLALTSCGSYDSSAVTGHATGTVPTTTGSGPFGVFRSTAYQAALHGAFGAAPGAAGKSIQETEAEKSQAFWK